MLWRRLLLTVLLLPRAQVPRTPENLILSKFQEFIQLLSVCSCPMWVSLNLIWMIYGFVRSHSNLILGNGDDRRFCVFQVQHRPVFAICCTVPSGLLPAQPKSSELPPGGPQPCGVPEHSFTSQLPPHPLSYGLSGKASPKLPFETLWSCPTLSCSIHNPLLVGWLCRVCVCVCVCVQ